MLFIVAVVFLILLFVVNVFKRKKSLQKINCRKSFSKTLATCRSFCLTKKLGLRRLFSKSGFPILITKITKYQKIDKNSSLIFAVRFISNKEVTVVWVNIGAGQIS